MNSADLAGIHDILPLETPTAWPAMLVGAVLLAAMLLLLVTLRRRFHPLARLERKLKNGEISTRQAAHRLACLVQPDTELKTRIDMLRFSRQPPKPASLLNIIDRVRGRDVF